MANEPDPGFDPFDADMWTLEALGFDKEEIIRSDTDAEDEQVEDFEAYRDRLLAPLRRLAERLRAEDEDLENSACERMGEGAGAGDGS